MRSVAAVLFVMLFGAGTCTALEALVYKQESRRKYTDAVGTENAEVLHQTIYATRDALRTETREYKAVTIVRLDEGVVYQFDAESKVYAAERIDAFQREVERYKEMLKSVYAEMTREKQERLAVALGKVKARAKAMETGERMNIAGHGTRKVAFYENGRLRVELWVTEAFRTETDVTPLLAATGEFSAPLLELLRKERGVALKSRIHPVLEIHPFVENEVVEIGKRQVDAEMFRVPAGLTKVAALEVKERAGPDGGLPGAPKQDKDTVDKSKSGSGSAQGMHDDFGTAPLP